MSRLVFCVCVAVCAFVVFDTYVCFVCVAVCGNMFVCVVIVLVLGLFVSGVCLILFRFNCCVCFLNMIYIMFLVGFHVVRVCVPHLCMSWSLYVVLFIAVVFWFVLVCPGFVLFDLICFLVCVGVLHVLLCVLILFLSGACFVAYGLEHTYVL